MNDIKDLTKMEIRSEGVDAILGKTPGKLITYGTSLILGFVVILLFGTMLFPYPEKIDCKFVITSSVPPIQLFSQTTGQIKMYVDDKQQVREGQVLAVINNPAEIADVLIAEKFLDSLNTDKKHSPFKTQSLRLGEMTQTFLDLEKSIDDYCNYINLNQIPQKIDNLKLQLEETRKRKNLLFNQLTILENDLKLSKNSYRRDSLMYKKEAIALSHLEESKSNLYQKESSYINANITYKNDVIQIEQLKITLLDLETEHLNQMRDLNDNISRNIRLLKNQIKDWKKKYVFISPYNGVVSFSTLWSDNQWIETDSPIMTILPQIENNVIGRMEIPIQRSGKVKNNQDVILKLSNYPYMEYGVLHGKIKSISLVPYKEHYIAEIEIPTLTTNYDYQIPFSQQMEGTASIIIKDLSLFDRFLQPVKSSIANGKIRN